MVAVIAGLITGFPRLDTRAQDAIAAGRHFAVVATVIGVAAVAVVASFIGRIVDRKICAPMTVTAAWQSTMITTGVGLDVVTIVAGLAIFDLAVAAIL